MKVLFVTSECVPFCKTGGLGDVAGSLPQALAAGGDEVAVILPLYQTVADKYVEELTFVKYIYVTLAWRSVYCGLFRCERGGRGGQSSQYAGECGTECCVVGRKGSDKCAKCR